jgi:hypothetical protein
VTDYCGLVSGKTTDKAELFRPNHLFIGEIVGAYCGREFMTDGNPDLRKIDPVVLSMPDNQYWAVGEPIGRAWSVGKGLKKTRR